MSSKSRGGLSKRELAAKQAVKKPAVKKAVATSKNSSSKSYLPASLSGANLKPILSASQQAYQKKLNDQFYASPEYAAQKAAAPSKNIALGKSSSSSKDGSKSSSSNRSKAAKVFNAVTGTKTVNAASGDVDYNKVSLKPNTGKQNTGILNTIGRVIDPFGIKSSLRNSGFELPSVDLGVTEALGLSKNIEPGLANFKDEQGRALGMPEQQAMYDYNRFSEENPDSTETANEFIANRNNANEGIPMVPYSSSGRETALARRATQTSPFADDRYESEKKRLQDNDPYLSDIKESSGQDQGQEQANPLADYLNVPPTDVTPVQPVGGTQQVRSGRGMGMFGTGKGVGNPATDDPYLQEMRKGLKGFGSAERDIRDEFEDLIKSLDPTFDEYSNDIKKSVDSELNTNLARLAAVMNANNTGDSEQRAQMMAGLQRDSGAQLGDLLRKLMLDKQEKVSGYKSQRGEALRGLGDKKMSAREKYAEALRQSQQDQFDREYKLASLSKKGSAGDDDWEDMDKAFEKDAKAYAENVLSGKMSREDAARFLRTYHPDYDENVIYDLVPDKR